MLPRRLRMAGRDGSRCATLVLLIGTVFGVGLVRFPGGPGLLEPGRGIPRTTLPSHGAVE